ncbi:hypothetical protein R3P38DRAFT_3608189 [Favolaschia claudopus]|uniref:DUF6534 domain-containing protein n=1 Tax=Favolaschia claudopus TaxID=2862362 RepID=A0AAW0DIB9_9AGAR
MTLAPSDTWVGEHAGLNPLYLIPSFTVCFLLLVAIVDACLNASDIVFWFATSFGDALIFSQTRFSKLYLPVFSTMVAFIVQLCFCYRIIIIRRAAWPISLVIAVLALTQLVGATTSSAFAFIEENMPRRDAVVPDLHAEAHEINIYLWGFCGVAADILIVIMMIILLSNRLNNKSTQSVRNRIIFLVIETNLFTTALNLVGTIMFAVLPPTNLYLYIPSCCLTGSFANTLLATLNNRAVIARSERYHEVFGTTIGFDTR